ncbi:MAG TPA: transglutaminase domain-containing protein [Bacteroidales bacterium]|nr:transglutaminase domain-containing protein [Bacteroidales bacterium]
MAQKINLIVILFFCLQPMLAQQKIPMIRAKSLNVDIRDAGILQKNYWIIDSNTKPDVYPTNNKNKEVTFYTDLDSISFTIEPDKKYEFIILVNGKDSAFTQIIYKPSFLDILKSGENYNSNDKREFPEFSFQASDNPNLIALRKAFNLDSIAGKGNDVSQILNLLHWIHNLVPHDGNHENPFVRNAISMLSVCEKEKRGLNCRGLSIVLNECYLSLGIKSRHITCLPKDSTDIECHAINMVYAKSLNKWLWIDPTFDAYIKNEKGELLGIQEVRERLINGKMLILNPDANWNHKTPQTKEYYLENYMAKNLYILEIPINSQFDLETGEKGKVISYLRLLPLDYSKQKPDKSERKYLNGTTIIKYNTNNPDLFWQNP